jgi:hypothetical protein
MFTTDCIVCTSRKPNKYGIAAKTKIDQDLCCGDAGS